MAASLDALVPELAEPARALVDAAAVAGLQPRITSTLRSHAEQKRLYVRRQSGLQPFPVALPGTSPHEYGWAFDMVVTPFDALADVGATWESWGGAYGGTNRDPVHFELPGASAEARRIGAQSPDVMSIDAEKLRSYLNLALSFLPVVGVVAVGAWLASLIPGLSQRRAVRLLQNPFDMEIFIASAGQYPP